MKTVLTLPIPPTTNNLYPSGRDGRRFKSAEYAAWETEAGYALKCQQRHAHPGWVAVHYEFGRFKDKRRRDVFNREKGVSDLLVSHGILADDGLIDDGRCRWVDDVPEGFVRATVEDL